MIKNLLLKRKWWYFDNIKHVLIVFVFVSVSMLSTQESLGQINNESKRITLNIKDKNVIYILKEVEKISQIGYTTANSAELEKIIRSINIKDAPINKVMDELLKNTKFTYTITDNIIVIKTNEAVAPAKMLVKGRVLDEKGSPIVGATVIVHGTVYGTASDSRGNYSLKVNPDDVLRVSFIGYKPAMTIVDGKSVINFKLEPTVESLDEVAVVAFGEQKKESMVSSITTVKASDLRSSNSDLTASFAGKIAGIIGWQTGGIPGALTESEMNTKFYIRGITSFQSNANIDPLILLDGVEVSKIDLARIDPEDIETFNVMKDASATAMYGARGANGVILVTTKRGKAGNVYTSVRYEVIASMPTHEIDVVDPITWMKMYNESQLERFPSLAPRYTAEYIKLTQSKKYPNYVYPATDWYDLLFKKMNYNHHTGINIRGGSNLIQYYASINYNQDMGMLKTDRLNQFDVNIKSKTTTMRLNFNIDLTRSIKLVFSSFTTMDKFRGPVTDVTEAYALAFNANPVDFAPTYPADDYYSWPEIRFGGSSTSMNNPYAMIQCGYVDKNRYSTINKFEYIHNLGTFVRGLEFRASYALSKTGYYHTAYETVPAFYRLYDYDHRTGKHQLSFMNEEQARRTLEISQDGYQTFNESQENYEAKLMHSAAWGDHQTSATVVVTTQENMFSAKGALLPSLPQRNFGLSARATYGYKDRYFVEASFGYNGSERFAKKNRMGFFPSIGCAWIVSKESFMGRLNKYLPFFKLRFSYGQVGNDGIIEDPRYVYLQSISKEVETSPLGGFTTVYSINNYADPRITWEIAEQGNLGVDFKLFNGEFDVTADIYREVRHNILSNRTVIPSTMGLEKFPLANIGKVLSRGVDLSAKIQHAFTNEFYVIFNTTFTYNKATYREIEDASNKPEWQNKIGKDISQQFGYIAEGLFVDQNEINSSPFQGGNVMPGDIKYKDVNRDGRVDVQDVVPIGYPETPRIIYGINAFIAYKGFEFSFAFQGSGNRAFFLNPEAISPFDGDRAMLREIYNDHWTSDNMKEKPFWPRLSTNNITTHNPQEKYYSSDANEVRKSTYFMKNGRFIRCTSIELGYNIPQSFSKKLRLKNVKFYARTNNPFIISNFKVWDIELGENGFNYPIQKTYSFGVNVSF